MRDEHQANFDKWFGDSKVVNGQGRPLVLYHETDADFSEFRIADGTRSQIDGEMPTGAFFKPNPKSIGVAHENGQSQMPVYLSLQNPLIASDRAQLVRLYKLEIPEYGGLVEQEEAINSKWKDDPRTDFATYTPESKIIFDAAIKEWMFELDSVYKKQKDLVNSWFRDSNYDGLIVENDAGSMGRRIKSYVAFKPEQIKSAIGNSGLYDRANPDITDRVAAAARALDYLDSLSTREKTLHVC